MIPLYAFLRGDSLGLVVIVDARQTIRDVANVVQQAASPRVAPVADPVVHARGGRLDPDLTVEEVGLGPLERIDVGSDAGAEVAAGVGRDAGGDVRGVGAEG